LNIDPEVRFNVIIPKVEIYAKGRALYLKGEELGYWD